MRERSPVYSAVMRKLQRRFYNRDTEVVAREVLGKHLVRMVNGALRVGRIVETEAYLGPHDLAAHSSRGRTNRTEVMFGPPGHAYVYLIYGMYHCLNLVTGPEDQASAVLLRALEPVRNIEGKTRGPGLLCRALAIDRSLNGADLMGDELFVAEPTCKRPFEVVVRPRIGVDYAGEWAQQPLRFYIKDNPFVSRK